jgi:hypothetical protein
MSPRLGDGAEKQLVQNKGKMRRTNEARSEMGTAAAGRRSG